MSSADWGRRTSSTCACWSWPGRRLSRLTTSASELKARAMALVKEADVDFVVANDISKVKGDTTSITIFDRKGRSETFEGSKALAAERVWRAILHGVRG